MYALSALIAVATVLLGLCMVVKMKQGTFWLVRIHRATGGSFVVLHYANTYSTLFFLFYAVLQGYMCVRAALSLPSPPAVVSPLLSHCTCSWQTERYTTGQWAPNNDVWFVLLAVLLSPLDRLKLTDPMSPQAHGRLDSRMARFLARSVVASRFSSVCAFPPVQHLKLIPCLRRHPPPRLLRPPSTHLPR